MTELTPAKTALQRAHEINERQREEVLRLSNAINEAVALVAMLLIVAGTFAYSAVPVSKRIALMEQEVVAHGK